MEERRVYRLAASAGAGKTYALAQRYLRLLLSDENAESLPRILAITFTNKAAGEMGERIVRWLKGLSLGRDPDGVRSGLKAHLELGDGELEGRCRRALAAIFRSPKDFQVRTIDSFLTTLAHSAAWEMGLSPGAKVEIRSEKLLDDAASDLMDMVDSDTSISREMMRFVMDQAAVKPDLEWTIRALITRNAQRLRLLETMRGEAFPPPSGDPAGEVYRTLIEGLKDVAAEMLALHDRGLLAVKGSWIDKVRDFLENGDIKAFDGSVHFGRDDPSALFLKNSPPPEEFLEAWARFRQNYSALVIQKAVAVAAPYVSVTERLECIMVDNARRDGLIILDRLPFEFAGAFEDDSRISSTFFYWGERLDHLLIDEFQDTSLVQWRALGPLAETALSQGGTLFFVGDRKQSIYGFRGGNPELFDTVASGLERFGVRSEPLDTNWRSGRELVDFAGEAFSRERLEGWAKGLESKDPLSFKSIVRANIGEIAAEFEGAGQKARRDGGLVVVERVDPPSECASREEILSFVTLKACGELLAGNLLERGYRQGDVAFLVRDNLEASVVSRTLLENGFSVASKATMSLDANRTSMELRAFLAFLDSPLDDLSFATFLLGKMFTGAPDAPSRGEVLEFLAGCGERRRRPLYPLFRERYTEAWGKLIEPHFNSVGYLAPYDLLQQVLEHFDVRGRFPGEEAFIYKFLDLMTGAEESGESSLRAFLDAWEDPVGDGDLQVPLPEGAVAVRVMTMHKAKGLGIPIVIIPMPYFNGRRESVLAVETGDGGSIPAAVSGKAAAASPVLGAAFLAEAVRVALSEVNALYVASTRAERELYIYLPSSLGGDGRKIGTQLWETRRGSATSAVGRPPQPPEHPREARRINSWGNKLLIRRGANVCVEGEESAAAKRRGTLVHLALQAGAASEGEVAAALAAEMADGLEVAEVWGILGRLTGHGQIGPLLHPSEGVERHDEVSILDADGELYRIDRLLISGDEVTVVDWKTGDPDEAKHVGQVSNYCRLAQGLYPGKTVRGILVYVDSLECREVWWRG